MRADLADIAICDFTAADIDGFLAYWYDSGEEHLTAMGVDPQKLPSRKKMREMLEWNIQRDMCMVSPQKVVSIKLRGETVGVHELTHLSPRDGLGGGLASGVMHAHIWRPEHRHLGIGLVSYVKAMQVFFDRLGLEAILFESPADNPGVNAIKARLGIPALGEGVLDLPILRRPLRTVRYRVTRADLPAIADRMRQVWCERGNTILQH